MMYSAKKKKSTFWANVIEIAGLLLIVFLIRTFGFGLYQVPTGSMETTMLVGERFFADKFTYLFRDPRPGEVIAFNEPPAFYDYSENKLMNLYESYVWGPSNWTKRIIGKPGDTVRGVIEDGKPAVYVNDKKLDEPYLNKYPLIALFSGNEESPLDYRSYDARYTYQLQPFYKMNPYAVRVGKKIAELTGEADMKYSGTPATTAIGYGLKKDLDRFDVHLGPNQYWVMGDNRLGSHDSRSWGTLDGQYIHGKIIWRLWSMDSNESWFLLDLIKHPIEFWKKIRWNRCFQVVR